MRGRCDLGSEVIGRSAQGVGPLVLTEALGEPHVRDFDVPLSILRGCSVDGVGVVVVVSRHARRSRKIQQEQKEWQKSAKQLTSFL